MTQARLRHGLAAFASLRGGWLDAARADDHVVQRSADGRYIEHIFVHDARAVVVLRILVSLLQAEFELGGHIRVYRANDAAEWDQREFTDPDVDSAAARQSLEAWLEERIGTR